MVHILMNVDTVNLSESVQDFRALPCVWVCAEQFQSSLKMKGDGKRKEEWGKAHKVKQSNLLTASLSGPLSTMIPKLLPGYSAASGPDPHHPLPIHPFQLDLLENNGNIFNYI